MGGPLQRAVEQARGRDDLVVLEGVHALKHAVRFGADVLRTASRDPEQLAALLDDFAPDVTIPVDVEQVPDPQWRAMTGGGLPSPALALAVRPPDTIDDVLATRATPQRQATSTGSLDAGPRAGAAPVVALEAPTHLGNVGAVVRVAAAANAAGVVVLGDADPWHPRAVRGGAGLQFALPVARRTELDATARPIVAVDPDGDDVRTVDLPADALLVFGTERAGLSSGLLDRADLAVSLPMRAGVSSLNLATSVAALLYGRMPPP